MKSRHGRVRIRAVSLASSLLALLLAVLVMMLVVRLRRGFIELYDTTEQYIVCVNTAREMQDGSNYLTEQARLFTLWGDIEYLDHYFTEENETRRVDLSAEKLQEYSGESDSFAYITTAFQLSRALTEIEYRAMRLMVEAMGVDPAEWPQELLDTVLSEEEAALSKHEKVEAAQRLLRSRTYQEKRDGIAASITAYRDTMAAVTRDQQTKAADRIFTSLWLLGFHSVLLVVSIFASWALVYLLIVKPIARGIRYIRRGELAPVRGAVEVRELASAYNEMFEENQEKQRIIRREAERDALTELLNRRCFERTLGAYKQAGEPFALMIVDIDIFKTINDTMGHSVGDAVIKRVASALGGAFRGGDHICRIVGDEFAVIVSDITKADADVICRKMAAINERLSVPEDGVPTVSLSSGVAFANNKKAAERIFENADEALYRVKKNGRNGCAVY